MNISAMIDVALVLVFVPLIALATESPQNGQAHTIVLLGDSTTATREKLEIYANWLARELPHKGIKAKIINAGVGGNTTQNAMNRFEQDVLQKNPGLVVIQFGINDSTIDVWKNPPETKPRVSKKEYIHNLEKITETLKARKCGVILMTPNPMCWTAKLKSLYGKPPYLTDDADGFNVILREYAQAVRQLAERQKIPLVDVYAAFSAYGKADKQSISDLLLDGMHPNDKGHRIVADLLFKEIVKLNGSIIE